MYKTYDALHPTKNIFNYSRIAYSIFKPTGSHTASWYNPASCIIFFKDAEAEVECNASTYRISGNSLIFIPQHYFFRITFLKKYADCYQFSLFPEPVCRKSKEHKEVFTRLLSVAENVSVVSLDENSSDKLTDLFSRVFSEPTASAGEWLNLAMLKLSGDCFQASRRVPGICNEQLASEINQITDYLLRHLHLDLSLDIISSRFHYDKNYFCRKFKKDTNYTFSQFVALCRISASVEYLCNGYSPEMAGKLCGYKNLKAYVLAFKSLFSVSPKKFIYNTNNYAFSSTTFLPE